MTVMIRKIRNSILLQMISIIMIILVILTGVFIVARRYVRTVAEENAENLADNLLRQADNALSIYEDMLRYNAAYLCRFSLVDRLGEGTSLMGSSAEAQISSYFSQITLKNGEIRSAVLFDTDMNEIASFGKKTTFPEQQRYLRYEEDLNADYYYEDIDDFFYAFYYPIYSTLNGQGHLTGMCVFVLDHWTLDGTIRNLIGMDSAAILISDSKHLDLSWYTGGSLADAESMDSLKTDPDIVFREGDWQNGIRIATATSIVGNEERSKALRQLIVVAFSLTLALLAFIILFFYTQMAQPLHKIARFIDRTMRHPDDRLGFKRTDDVGVVAARLDHMLDENQKMLQEVRDGKIRLYETQLAQQEMEILAYRNQINPHFLYNTLSCMRDMALIHDEDDIAEMAMALSDIFRYAVKGSNIVTVRDEIEYIDKYAKIIDYRFMGKITIDVNADEEVLDKPVIRFFLQPLVENSVFHGLEASVDPGFVDVRISYAGGRIEIEIEDDGCGMDEETLEGVRYQLQNPGESASIGLSNIVQRLRLFYGHDYTISIDSKTGEGTRIGISIPDHIKDSGERNADTFIDAVN